MHSSAFVRVSTTGENNVVDRTVLSTQIIFRQINEMREKKTKITA